MATYFYDTITVTTAIQQNGDTILKYYAGSYVECYIRRPTKDAKDHWRLRLIDTFIPVRESDVPIEVRMSWVYCYERALPVIEIDTLYAL